LYGEVASNGQSSRMRTGGTKSHKAFLQQIHPTIRESISPDSFFGCAKEKRTEIVPEYLLNMKEMHSIAKVDSPPKDVFNIVCDNIIAKMIDNNVSRVVPVSDNNVSGNSVSGNSVSDNDTIDIISLRDNLYDILLYGLDVTECLWYILYHFVENGILLENESETILSEIMDKTDSFLKFYNNNYRPIYHLESIFIYLITKIYRYPNTDEL
jgi:hypothetical protein